LLFLSKQKNQDLKTLIFNKKQIKSSPKYLIPAHFFFNSSPHFFNSSRINVKELFFLNQKKKKKKKKNTDFQLKEI